MSESGLVASGHLSREPLGTAMPVRSQVGRRSRSFAVLVCLLSAVPMLHVDTASAADFVPTVRYSSALPSPAPAANAGFGTTVIRDGNTLLVSEPRALVSGFTAGVVHSYDITSGTPVHQQTLSPASPASALRFGAAVAMDGDRLAIGLPGRTVGGSCLDPQGGVAVYGRDAGGPWTLMQEIYPPAGTYWCGNSWGRALVLENNRLVVGGGFGLRTYDVSGTAPVEVGALLHTVPGGNGEYAAAGVRQIAMTSDGSRLAFRDSGEQVTTMTWSPSGWTRLARYSTADGSTPAATGYASSLAMDETGLIVGQFSTVYGSQRGAAAHLFTLGAQGEITSARVIRMGDYLGARIRSLGMVALDSDSAYVVDDNNAGEAVLRVDRITGAAISVSTQTGPSGSLSLAVSDQFLYIGNDSANSAGAGLSFSGSLVLVPLVADVAGPTLTSVAMITPTLDPSLAASAAFIDLGFTDDLAGVASASVTLRGPSGQTLPPTPPQTFIRMGSETSGTMRVVATLPAGSEAGVWRVDSVELRDRMGHVTVTDPAGAGVPGTATAAVVAGTTVTNRNLLAYVHQSNPVQTNNCGQVVTMRLVLVDVRSGAERTLAQQVNACGGAFPSLPNFNASRTRLATIAGSSLRVYDVASGAIVSSRPGSCGRNHWSPDGSLLLCDGISGRLDLVNAANGATVAQVEVPFGSFTTIGWHDERTVLLLTPPQSGTACGTHGPRTIWRVPVDGSPASVQATTCFTNNIGSTLSHDRTRVLVGAESGSRLAVLNLVTGQTTPVVLAPSADGRDIAVASAAWTLNDSQIIVPTYQSGGSNSYQLEAVSLLDGRRVVIAASGANEYRYSPSDVGEIATPPDTPAGVTATPGEHSATITWLRPADGGSPIIGYTVTATPGGHTCSTYSADALSCTIYGLTNGVNYTFQVVARNEVGTSSGNGGGTTGGGGAGGGTVTTTVGTPPSPVVVLPPVYEPGDGTQVTIRWLAAASSPELPVIGYTATATPGGQSCSTTGALFCTITGLTPGLDYTFTVVAVNGIGPSPVTVPAAPTAVTVSPGAHRQVVVSWQAPTSNGGSPILGYTADAGDGATCTTTGTTCVISDLTAGATYEIVVKATNAVGDSPWSTPSDPITIPTDVTPPVVTASIVPAPNSAGWSRGPVTIVWVVDDPTATVPGPVTVDAEGGQRTVVSAPSCDPVGNCAVGSAQIAIDTSPPSVSWTATPIANSAGWNNSPVTVQWACSDALSGVQACPLPTIVSDDGTASPASGPVCDVAGNCATASALVSIDSIAPSLEWSLPSPDPISGWYRSAVTAVPVCTDDRSGVAVCPEEVSLGDGAAQTVSGTVVDLAGNAATNEQGGLNVDSVAPSIDALVVPSITIGPWYTSPVTVIFQCADATSGIAVCPTPASVGDGAGQTVTGTAFDVAGNAASVTVSGLDVDSAAPVVTWTVDPLPNAAGWNNTPVVVSFECSDSGSGTSTCPSPVVVDTEVEDFVVQATASDVAGNSTTVATQPFSVDLTPPAVELVGVSDGQVFSVGSAPVVTCTTTDALSGVASAAQLTTSGGNPDGTGVFAAICSGGADVAGNLAVSVVATYEVHYLRAAGTFTGGSVQAPPSVNSGRGGRTYSVQWTLQGGSGAYVTDLAAVTSIVYQAVSCSAFESLPTSEVDADSSGQSGLRSSGNSLVFNWKTPSTAGCYQLRVYLRDGSVLRANFNLT